MSVNTRTYFSQSIFNMHSISVTDAWKSLWHDANSHLIDVRTREEWGDSGVPDITTLKKDVLLITWHGDQNAFMDLIYQAISNKSEKIFVICRKGIRSMSVTNLLLSHGYINSFNIIDGFETEPNGWKSSNLPWRKLPSC